MAPRPRSSSSYSSSAAPWAVGSSAPALVILLALSSLAAPACARRERPPRPVSLRFAAALSPGGLDPGQIAGPTMVTSARDAADGVTGTATLHASADYTSFNVTLADVTGSYPVTGEPPAEPNATQPFDPLANSMSSVSLIYQDSDAPVHFTTVLDFLSWCQEGAWTKQGDGRFKYECAVGAVPEDPSLTQLNAKGITKYYVVLVIPTIKLNLYDPVYTSMGRLSQVQES